MTDLSNRNYLRWDSPGVEKVPPGETEDIQAVADMINAMQKAMFNKTRHAYGGTHARTQGIVKGTFVVPDDLPKHLKQTELFEKGGEYPAACRYSSEPGDPGLDDRIPQPRGFAMKVFNVHGDMYEAGAHYPTQDIEFNSAPAIELADAKTTREVIELRLKYGGGTDEYYKHLKQRPDKDLQLSRDQVLNTHLESHQFHGQSAYRFGDYVVKYRLQPSSETQKKLADETVKPDQDDDQILSKWLSNFHNNHDGEWHFQVQLLENLDDQLVEYAGSIWDEEKYPFQTVAILKIPKQGSWSYEAKAFWEDHLRVDPWLGLKSLQPLGGANRLRRVVYPQSAGLRRMMNGRKEINAKSIDEISTGSGKEGSML